MLFLFQLQIKKIKRFKTPKCPTKFKTNEINILLMKYLVHCTYYCLILYIDEYILLSVCVYIYIYIYIDNCLVNQYITKS